MNKSFGIIAEDESDYKTLRILLNRILDINNVSTRKAIGKGCAKIKAKCRRYAENLKQRGCNCLIVTHDLDCSDRKKYSLLMRQIEANLSPCPIDNYIIIIPVQEIEGWLLSDLNAIREVFGSRIDTTKEFTDPEIVEDPKETIANVVKRKMNKRYVNTIHNEKIADKIDLDRLYNCDSYKPLYHFVTGTEWDSTIG